MTARVRTIYLAAPLFTQAERLWNRSFAEALASHLATARVILPQTFDEGGRDVPGHSGRDDPLGALHARCVAGLEQADLLVAILDGADVDSGVAWEMGYAAARGRPVVGVRTDGRAGQEQGVNLMCSRGCVAVVRARAHDEDLTALAGEVAQAVAERWGQTAGEEGLRREA